MLLVLLAAILLHFLPASCRAEDGRECYTPGGVAGIVIATVVVTIVFGGLAAAAVWYLWKQRPALSGEAKKKPGSTFFTSALEKNCANLEQRLPEKKRPPEGGKEAYAFDNPYFKDDEMDAKSKNQDAAEKGEAGFRTDNGNIRNSQDNKVNAGPKLKKNRPFSNIQFPNVFHQGFKKPRAMDDTYIPKPLERVEVPLRGHDFTGLGFNICGNMRDGIFVKDVLHRGPASESGKIKAGDRIIGVWVSFGGMVYEDALTILSYASPYDVRLELEKTVDTGRNLALPASSPASKTRLVSSSFRTGQRLFHPLYRSQSFDDLTQIGKDNHLPLNNNNGSALAANTNPCSSCPKRSQSIEATSPKPRIQHDIAAKESRKSSTSSCESAKKGSPVAPKAVPTVEAKKEFPPEVQTSRFYVETVPLQKTAAEPISQPSLVSDNTASEVELKLPDPEVPEEVFEEFLKYEDSVNSSGQDNRPTAPPRKVPVHIKRKAPAPPKGHQDSAKTETSAIVHRDAEEDALDGESRSHPDTEDASDRADGCVSVDNSGEGNDVQSLSGDCSEAIQEAEDPGSSPKRKASSLGDLTKLDSVGHKKSPAAVTILERAVSLDLQQTLPEGNLVKQKMTLRTPTFEDPEDTSEEDLLPNPEEKKSPASLTRWEGGLFKPQVVDTSTTENESQSKGLWPASVEIDITPGITNGHNDVVQPQEGDRQSYFAFESPNEQALGENRIQVTSTPVRKIIESESFFKDSVDIDDIPYLGEITVNSASELLNDPSSNSAKSAGGGTHSTPPPISLSIPIIRPNFSQYEKLSGPGKSQTAQLSPSPCQETTSSEEQRQDVMGQDISSIESSYKPVFSLSSFRDSSLNSGDASASTLSALDIVNGNGLEVSTSSCGQYRTASEDSSVSEVSLIDSKLSKDTKKPSLPEMTGIKIHGGAAGFAKTLIISTPIEGESISLNDDLDSPPPNLEPPV